ncbi:methyltransferase [candidate division WOR_3 bacterium SM23_60]|uniref:Methyltransferase n=1 Tax=candidate division WOR_3 bacterium SM23_60 TaxID=1703780 RepID=A0A0S8GC94_UNCW3|nr:MAG: methyltransferase [candidate division WOR_3 bacterium SM23_60]
MLHEIPQAILKRMRFLEELDQKHREENMSHLQRLRQITPDTGRFLAILAAGAPAGTYLEIGTSGGYSTLWLALACRQLGRKIVTFEILEEKVAIARETFHEAGVEDIVELIHGDARDCLHDYKDISFCFLDAEKKIYQECYELVVPNMIPGGVLVADNAISHKDILHDMIEHALHDNRVDAVVVPIGRGELVCRKV